MFLWFYFYVLMSLICWNLFRFEHRGGVWGFGVFFLLFFFFARMLVVSWLGSGSVGCVRSYFCFLVTALCWLSRNTLDAFLSSSPSGRLSQQYSPVFVKTLKALTSGTIWA